MQQTPFVKYNSIVREIWGRRDVILFIFGGASAEFALNKAVDWLYFTGRLPADPIGRLFSTVTYARKIVFSTQTVSLQVIDAMRNIHQEVENKRQASIPDWAYRDVLFMLIHYSIASYELLERKLTNDEKEEVFQVFYRVGDRMGLKALPNNYNTWVIHRSEHLHNNLEKSKYTTDLFLQYKKHLGTTRFHILVESQKLVVPVEVRTLLQLDKFSLAKPFVYLYKFFRLVKLDWFVMSMILPKKYIGQIRNLEV